jgi:hypothetical protein
VNLSDGVSLYRLAEDHLLVGGSSKERPVLWEDLIANVSETVSGKPPSRLSVMSALSTNKLTISWSPNLATLIAALAGRPLIHLCWGIPRPSASRIWTLIRMLRLSLLLRRALAVLVNEPATLEDVRRIAKRDAILIPYVVDTSFFFVETDQSNEDFVLVPGNNGRDEELVCALAATGVRIIRVTFDAAVREYYATTGSNRELVEVRFAVSYRDLRDLYRRAAIVWLPLKLRNHPAGQTAVLEALACGTPVIMSRGRIAELFSTYPGVHLCDTDAVQAIREQVITLTTIRRNDNPTMHKIHQYVRARHSPELVTAHLRTLLDEVVNDLR